LEDVDWPIEKLIEKDWAISQVLTSKDYSENSTFWTYFSGYLNYQVVHHLFPSVAPHYYPEIVGIVKQVCLEYNVKFDHDETFYSLLMSHWRHIKQFQSFRDRFFKKYDEKGNKIPPISDIIYSFIKVL